MYLGFFSEDGQHLSYCFLEKPTKVNSFGSASNCPRQWFLVLYGQKLAAFFLAFPYIWSISLLQRVHRGKYNLPYAREMSTTIFLSLPGLLNQSAHKELGSKSQYPRSWALESCCLLRALVMQADTSRCYCQLHHESSTSKV